MPAGESAVICDCLFPEVWFQRIERERRQGELRDEKYTRQRHKEQYQHQRAYQALAGQAEIELAFETPATVRSWSSRWFHSGLHQYDLEDMFWRWSERFPSLTALERHEFSGESLWSVVYEASLLTEESPAPVRLLEHWIVPNKLTLACSQRNRLRTIAARLKEMSCEWGG